MTYNPATLQALGSYWVQHGGVNLGVVGNTAHTSGYHLGRDRIFATGGLGWSDYSVKLARDKADLTDAASAIDLGKLGGSIPKLRAFSIWLVARCQAGAPGTADIREIIYSPDGQIVLRWDRERGYASAPRTGEADNSHITHTHVSFYRDSESRDKTAIFAPYFALPATSTAGGIMPAISSYLPGYSVVVKSGMNVRDGEKLTSAVLRATSAAETWQIVGTVKGDLDTDCGGTDWIVAWANGRWEYTSKCNISSGPTPPATSTPATDCTKEIAAVKATAAAELAAAVAFQKTNDAAQCSALIDSTAKERVANALSAERSRIRGILGL